MVSRFIAGVWPHRQHRQATSGSGPETGVALVPKVDLLVRPPASGHKRLVDGGIMTTEPIEPYHLEGQS